MVLLLILILSFKDNDPLITQELVNEINSNPKSTFKAVLNPDFAKLTIGDAKKFLSPIRPLPRQHGSATPIGSNETEMEPYVLSTVTGLNQVARFSRSEVSETGNFSYNQNNPFYLPIYDIRALCSSWAPAVTSAISVSRWNSFFVNYSLQFILDCDIVGDACAERPPLSSYEQF
jgi:hypothetical protein